MGSTFLTLTNSVLEQLNEVQLTAGNFAAATGVQAVAKSSVNRAIREINNDNYEWPFNHAYTSQTLTADDWEYDFGATTKTVDWDTFFLAEDTPTTATRGKHLPVIPYDEYVSKGYRRDNENTAVGSGKEPQFIIPGQSQNFFVYPVPDVAYSIEFEHWTMPVDLSADDDTTTIPVQFDAVIFHRAIYYLYLFKEDLDAAREADEEYEDSIGRMRGQLINANKFLRVTDTRTGGRRISSFGI
jgi:hypothetical protein